VSKFRFSSSFLRSTRDLYTNRGANQTDQWANTISYDPLYIFSVFDLGYICSAITAFYEIKTQSALYIWVAYSKNPDKKTSGLRTLRLKFGQKSTIYIRTHSAWKMKIVPI